MKVNLPVGPVFASGQVDWDAAAQVAARCGGRAHGLVAVRNVDGLKAWLPWASRATRRVSPETAELYDQLLELVTAARGANVGDVDRHGDLVGGAA
jgi:hypothetical protein